MRRKRGNTPVSSEKAEREAQVRSNFKALSYFEHFASHRAHLTALAAPPGARGGELCVLGAGNAYDLDLDLLSGVYDRVHLVDIDEAALARVSERHGTTTRARLTLHAPVDLSGFGGVLARWNDRRIGERDATDQPKAAVARLLDRFGRRFRTVLSACLLSQMQLGVRRVLTDRHPLFAAASFTLNLTHLRTLSALKQPGGRAILATDIASNAIAAFDSIEAERDPHSELNRLLASGDVFSAVDPRWLTAIARDDPTLSSQDDISGALDVWLWHNGPTQKFLVYAIEI